MKASKLIKEFAFKLSSMEGVVICLGSNIKNNKAKFNTNLLIENDAVKNKIEENFTNNLSNLIDYYKSYKGNNFFLLDENNYNDLISNSFKSNQNFNQLINKSIGIIEIQVNNFKLKEIAETLFFSSQKNCLLRINEKTLSKVIKILNSISGDENFFIKNFDVDEFLENYQNKNIDYPINLKNIPSKIVDGLKLVRKYELEEYNKTNSAFLHLKQDYDQVLFEINSYYKI